MSVWISDNEEKQKKNKEFIIVPAFPEPRFIPGYTGHCPDIIEQIGGTYGHSSHAALKENPCWTGRLSSTVPEIIKPEGTTAVVETDSRCLRDMKVVRERMSKEENPLLTDIMIPGYTGHVPKARDCVGKTFPRSCVTAIAEFERSRRTPHNYEPEDDEDK